MFKEILTDPREHNPDSFVYLVHGLLDLNGDGISPEEIKDRISRVKNPNQFYRTSMIAHLDGESAKRRIGWLRGEIKQLGTFGGFGLIVNPACDSLVRIAWNCDIGSPAEQQKLAYFVLKHWGKIKSPLELLTQTKGYDGIKYNELVIAGNEATAVQGVFYRDEKSRARADELSGFVKNLTGEDVALVEFPPISVLDTADSVKNHPSIDGWHLITA